MKILYVDDHTPFRAVVQRRFLAGHDVTGAENLAEARRRLAESDFDVLLLDYQLRDGLGEELIPEAAAKSVKVIACSANAEQNERLVSAGAMGVISKNEFSKLAEKLESLLNGG